MNLEIEALHRNNTYILADLPPGRKAIGCMWIWKIKYKSSGEIDRYKARLVAKGFSQREGIEYEETFSPVVKMVTVRCLIALSVQNNRPLYQLDVNNAFLYGDLKEEVYMELPLGYYDKNETKNDIFIVILVYVDDILITGNNEYEIDKLKKILSYKFMIKNLGLLKYFLGIEVLENKNGLCLSQIKYYLELLSEYGLLACKPAATPLQKNVVLNHEEFENDKFLPSMTEHQKIVGRLIYLSITRLDISYVVHCLSHHMHAPLQSHFTAALRVLRYIKNAPSTVRSKQPFIGLLQNMSIDVLLLTYELIWVVKILKDLEVDGLIPTHLYCDSSSAIFIVGNPVFHEKTKHFEIDLHLVRKKVTSGVIKVLKVA
ncbi:ribonuclease H-like domain-containing protein [Tanacetum coccineum]